MTLEERAFEISCEAVCCTHSDGCECTVEEVALVELRAAYAEGFLAGERSMLDKVHALNDRQVAPIPFPE
jgi:hypothetical protein